jgi:taurine dioxygenase
MSAATATPSAATAAPQSFEIRPFSGAVGAEIIGLDLTRPVNDQDFARIHRAHLDHHVVVFRDQRITPNSRSISAAASACCRSTCSSSSCWPTTRKS